MAGGEAAERRQPEAGLLQATVLSGSAGRYRAQLRPEWMGHHSLYGGYLAATALRAAAETSGFERAASLSCHFLTGAQPGPTDIEVVSLRRNTRSESLRVSLRQDGHPVLEAQVWIGIEGDGYELETQPMPRAASPDQVPERCELLPAGKPIPRVWERFEARYCDRVLYEPARPRDPQVDWWWKLAGATRGGSTLEDALRLTAIADGTMHDPYHQLVGGDPDDHAFGAPTMELSVHFHRASPASEWIFCRSRCDAASAGLITGSASFWAGDTGRLVASARSNLACRPRGKPRPSSRPHLGARRDPGSVRGG